VQVARFWPYHVPIKVGGRPRSDFDRARRIGEFYGNPKTRTFAQLLLDLEESPHSRAIVLGELREREIRRST